MPYIAPTKEKPSDRTYDASKRELPKRLRAYLKKGHIIKRAVHIRGDMRGKQSCSFCGVGQVDIKKGAWCGYCKAKVVQVVDESQAEKRAAR